MPRGLRVVVADDNALLREGIASLLEDAGHEVVGRAGSADDLLSKVRSYTPDVAIVDVRMPPGYADDGLVAAAEIRRTHPDVAVLVLSQHLEPAYMLELVGDDAEGVGYLLDDLTDRERDVLALIAEGRSNRAIGNQLFLSSRAVERHVQSIFQKLRLPDSEEDNRRVLAVLALLGT